MQYQCTDTDNVHGYSNHVQTKAVSSVKIAVPGVHCTNQHKQADMCKFTRSIHDEVKESTSGYTITLLTHPLTLPSSFSGNLNDVHPSNSSATVSSVADHGTFPTKIVRWLRSSLSITTYKLEGKYSLESTDPRKIRAHLRP